jgi:hypothetical protein
MQTSIEIDSDLLIQFNWISAILGISPARYIETYLKDLPPASLGQDPVLYVANELFCQSFRSPGRKLLGKQRSAARLEKLAGLQLNPRQREERHRKLKQLGIAKNVPDDPYRPKVAAG